MVRDYSMEPHVRGREVALTHMHDDCWLWIDIEAAHVAGIE